MKKIIRYLRVSTSKQVTGLEVQREMLDKYEAYHDAITLESYCEVESGRNNKRPELAAAIDHAKFAGATLVVAKMDRLARDVEFTSSLMNAKVDFVICDMPDADENMMLHASMMAQYEVNQIRSRTSAALQFKKRAGVLLGSSRPDHWAGREDRRLEGQRKGTMTASKNRITKADRYAQYMRKQIELLPSGLTLDEIAEALTKRGFESPNGGVIVKSTISKVLSRTCPSHSLTNS
jgi:DNA invertase Pin-like site-specific DNA recombinase